MKWGRRIFAEGTKSGVENAILATGCRLEKGNKLPVWWKQCGLLLLATTHDVDKPPYAIFARRNLLRRFNANAEI
jgi:hypothetical protein